MAVPAVGYAVVQPRYQVVPVGLPDSSTKVKSLVGSDASRVAPATLGTLPRLGAEPSQVPVR